MSTQSRFVDIIPDTQVKIESKDHMWKPAPIMGRDFTQREVIEPEIQARTNFPSASLRGDLRGDPLENNFVLP